jgi:hypothetical protein
MNEETEVLSSTKDYINFDGLSYSSLSRLAEGPKAYLDKDGPSGSFLDTGSAVDILLTEGEEAFHKQFYVMTASKPTSDMMLRYTEEMIATDNPQLAYAASGFKRPVTDEKWESDGKPYYDAVKTAGDRAVLDMDQYMAVQATVNQLKENKYTRQYFSKPPEGIEIIYQFIHYFQYADIDGKVKLDIVAIDHNNKTILPIDLKTTSKPPQSFISSYRSYKYYLQGAWFSLGIKAWADVNYPDYTVKDFMFIVAEMGARRLPLLFTMDKEQTSKAISGGETFTGYRLKGIDDLIEDLKFYKETDQWDYPREVVLENGKIELDLFK